MSHDLTQLILIFAPRNHINNFSQEKTQEICLVLHAFSVLLQQQIGVSNKKNSHRSGSIGFTLRP